MAKGFANSSHVPASPLFVDPNSLPSIAFKHFEQPLAGEAIVVPCLKQATSQAKISYE